MKLVTNGEQEFKLPVIKVIIPFSFDENTYDDCILRYKNAGWSTKKPFEQNELFTHISSLLQDDNKYAIGCNIICEYDKSVLLINNQEYNYELKLLSGELYIFKTGIAFYVMNLHYNNVSDLDEIIERNNSIIAIFKKCEKVGYTSQIEIVYDERYNHDNENIAIEAINIATQEKILLNKDMLLDVYPPAPIQIISKGSKKYIRYTRIDEQELTEFIYNELSDIYNKNYFINEFIFADGKPMISKANIFSYVLVDNKEKSEIETSIFHLSKGYKNSYQKKLEVDAYIFSTFNNSVWSVAREGVSNIVSLVEDEQTNSFFKKYYLNRIDNYFYLYIIALHQYYGLIYLAEKISTLPSSIDDYTMDGENYKKLLSIYDKVNYLYLKCVFHEVTHISHQAEVYNKLYSMLGIDYLLNEINFEMDRLTDIVNVLRNKIQKDELKESKEQFYATQMHWQEEKEYRQKLEKEKVAKEKFLSTIGSTFGWFFSLIAIWNFAKSIKIREWEVFPIEWSGITREIVFVVVVILIGIGIGSAAYRVWRKVIDC